MKRRDLQNEWPIETSMSRLRVFKLWNVEGPRVFGFEILFTLTSTSAAAESIRNLLMTGQHAHDRLNACIFLRGFSRRIRTRL